MITLQQLNEMFANMRATTNWDLDGDMRWGYFFTDPNPKKLEPVAKHLSDAGYRVVSIYETDDKRTHFLHVERVEHHTPTTLDARNQEFEALAARFGIATYDGMDAGPATPTPKPKLLWYQQAWLALPFALVIVGGAAGGACGGAAWVINLKVFQRTEHPVLRYVWTGLISAAAAVVYAVVALVLMSFFNGQG